MLKLKHIKQNKKEIQPLLDKRGREQLISFLSYLDWISKYNRSSIKGDENSSLVQVCDKE